MKKYRLLVRTVQGHRISSQLTVIDAARAAAFYKFILGGRVEILPDTRSLRQEHAQLDRTAATQKQPLLQAAGFDSETGNAWMWDGHFDFSEAREPAGRCEPTAAPAPPPAGVSPEKHLAGGRGDVLAVALYVCRRFWRWLMRPERGSRPRQSGFLAPRKEVESC